MLCFISFVYFAFTSRNVRKEILFGINKLTYLDRTFSLGNALILGNVSNLNDYIYLELVVHCCCN